MALFKPQIWETEWNGISLVDITKENRIPFDKVADNKVYREYYKKLEKNGFKLSQEWIEKKAKSAIFISEVVEKYLMKTNKKNPKILSIGAGLGIVELPLLLKGYDLTLQECQAISFNYLKNKVQHLPKTLICNDLSNVESSSFDVIFSLTSTYPLDDKTYLAFLQSMRRIVADDGIVVIWEHLSTLKTIMVSLVRKILRKKNNGILWGWLRVFPQHLSFINKAGLTPIEIILMDRNQNIKIRLNKQSLKNIYAFYKYPIGAVISKK